MVDEPSRVDLPARLRSERARRGWSIDELARRSGVSRAMISKIERGAASPTAELLGRLAVGFEVTLASLFAPASAEAAPPLARRDEQPVWRDPSSGYVRRNVSPPGWPVEIVEVEFPAGGRVLFDTYADAGIHQQIWIQDGVLELTLTGRRHLLEAGDCLAMRLDQPLAFHNPGERPVRYAVVLTQRRQP
jgi:transcriptional regulator with XRE-family HTH domain